MTSSSKRQTRKHKTPSGGGARRGARGPGRRAGRVSAAERDEKSPPASAKETAGAASAKETAGAAPAGETAAAATERTVAAEPARKGGGIAPFLWTVLALAALGGGAAATWPLWSPYFTANLASAPEDPFRDSRVTGLAGRVTALEETTTGAGSAIEDLEAERARSRQELKALMERLEGLERALGSVKKMVKATAPPAETVDTDEYLQQLSERRGRLEDNDETLEGLLERIARLEQSGAASGEGVQPAVGNEKLSAAVADISRRVGALEKTDTIAAGAVIGAQATVLAVGQLREALRRTAPFTKELQAVGAVAADNPEMTKAIAALEPYAASGIPTLSTLRRDFNKAAGDIVRAAVALQGDGWFEWTVNRLMSLVTVRRTTDTQDLNSAEAVVARAETSLKAGDLMAAVEELGGLKGAAAAAAAPWLEDARARLAAERAMTTLHVHAVSLLAPAKE